MKETYRRTQHSMNGIDGNGGDGGEAAGGSDSVSRDEFATFVQDFVLRTRLAGHRTE